MKNRKEFTRNKCRFLFLAIIDYTNVGCTAFEFDSRSSKTDFRDYNGSQTEHQGIMDNVLPTR